MLARECSNGFSLDTLLALHITSTSSGLPEMAARVVEAWLTSLVKRGADLEEMSPMADECDCCHRCYNLADRNLISD